MVPDSSIIQREKQEDLRFTAIPRLKVLLGLVFHFWFTPGNRVSFGKSRIPVLVNRSVKIFPTVVANVWQGVRK